MVFHVLLLVFMVLKGSFVVFVWFSYFVQKSKNGNIVLEQKYPAIQAESELGS